MHVGITDLRSRDQSAKSIDRFSNKWRELGPLLGLPLRKFFNRVRVIPFRIDPDGYEVTSRPKHLIKSRLFPALDCKKKAVLVQAWLKSRGLDSRLIGLSERPDKKIHHIFPQVRVPTTRGRKYLNVDATYPYYRLFEPKSRATRAQVLA